jgi:colanic acid/amylovoran biosynthesis glycosyltransferase
VSVKRIAYVVNCFPKLSETFVANELAELRRRGVDVRVLSLRASADEPQHEIVAAAGLAERATYDVEEFRSLLRSFEPQLVHAHFATDPTAVARTLAAELGVPFTFTAHGYDVYRRPPGDFADRAAAAAAVVTVSEANARYLATTHGVDPAQIAVLPCGVDTEHFTPGDAPLSPAHIVCVARLVPVKNLELLLNACRVLSDRRRDFRCVIVGDGRARDGLVALRDRLDLGDFVHLVGPARQSEVLAWWRRAAVAVLTSDSEGMPVTLMEAAACGVPALTTAVGGTPEIVDDGVTGLLAPAGDAGAIAAGLDRLLQDRGFAAQLGAAARRRAEERFSLKRQVDGLLSVWSGVVAA